METSVLYRIDCEAKSRTYVGSAFCFPARMHAHLSFLYYGNHTNRELQADFDELGAEAFVFTEIRTVDRAIAIQEEMKEIKQMHVEGVKLYNAVIPGVKTKTRRKYRPSVCRSRKRGNAGLPLESQAAAS